jgi:hypothetical protein
MVEIRNVSCSLGFFFSGLESFQSTFPAACYAARSGFMQHVAPVGSFPDRLRGRRLEGFET